MEFEATRKAFLEQPENIPISNLAVRLQRYEDGYQGTKNIVRRLKILEQAAKDMGGQFTNKQEITGANGGPIQNENTTYVTATKEQVRQVWDELESKAAQTGAVVAGETTKTIATSTGALARLAIKAGEAIKSIMMYAWEAMAGAFKAMVSIPYIGPVLAVAAGASALALVGGIAGNIKSARGGYDIPSGVNPVTQLHEEEMVLPKQHANTIRALGRSMSGGGMSEQPAYAGDMGMMPNINIQAWDSKDVKKFMKKHGRELAGGLKSHRRGFGK